MRNLRTALIASVLAALAMASGLALAGNTTLFGTSIGDVTFPFSPPPGAGGSPGAIDNMTIGATTPAPVTATNLTATGTVAGAGFTSRLAAPGPIGNTTPSTGAFTTLTASGQINSTTGTPTIASGACGTGANGVVTSGNNQSGLITIGASATTTCTVAYSATLGTAPNACVLFPANATAAATGTTVARVSSVTTAQFVITGSALASTAYYFLCL